MTLVDDVRGMSTNEEKARYINKILEEVKSIVMNDPELGLSVRYSRNRDDARFEMFAKYEGPDKATLSFLTDLKEGKLDLWSWVWGDKPMPSGNEDPLGIVVKNYMNTPHKAVASRAKASGYFLKEPLQGIEEAIGHMEEHGRRYMLLERDLGEGACLMLGEDLSESHWYKLLPLKDGPRREWALDYVKEAFCGHEETVAWCRSFWPGLIEENLLDIEKQMTPEA